MVRNKKNLPAFFYLIICLQKLKVPYYTVFHQLHCPRPICGPEFQLSKGPSTRKRSFAKTHMYCIVLADRSHGSWKHSTWKRTFWKKGLRVEKSESAVLAFSCGWRIRILSETMMPLPHPSTSSLRPRRRRKKKDCFCPVGRGLKVFLLTAGCFSVCTFKC